MQSNSVNTIAVTQVGFRITGIPDKTDWGDSASVIVTLNFALPYPRDEDASSCVLWSLPG